MPIKLQGKEFVTHEELVQWATEQGIESVTTELVHLDIEKREAVHKATATGKRGTFTGFGDCLPGIKGNVGGMVAAAFIRMSETRAVNRALRLYTGRGATSVDELGGNSSGPTGPIKQGPKPPASDAFKACQGFVFAQLKEAGIDYDRIVGPYTERHCGGRLSTWENEGQIRHFIADACAGRIDWSKAPNLTGK